MTKQVSESTGELMGLRYKSHPWHGMDIDPDAPGIVTAYIEMVPVDTVKYEVDKVSGYLKIERPQKYSNQVPALYGFIPQTYSGNLVAGFNAVNQHGNFPGTQERKTSEFEGTIGWGSRYLERVARITFGCTGFNRNSSTFSFFIRCLYSGWLRAE